ncbi:Potassium voltage-gated channel subfamily H member 7 (Ether-a-go-go-related gene potassium channel 3) (ERG-3) (Eag-related protein 3) (Ether-a-go-go-related protein 3) (hERG-3) (Voltage-gated potassium channel subunit Kv11.3) [Durusdinium trenchii]|uniref:Ion transport domain-containing protein n=1 Tax=Durusdinium trenchii TaxID=1381693 RepID=A0ABP0SS30_9DINO
MPKALGSLDALYRSLLTGYVNKGQLVTGMQQVMSPYQIFINYLKTWFLLDLVVVGPDWVITFIQLSAHGDEGGSAGSVGRLVRTIRVVRTVRLLRLVKLKRVIDMLKDRITSEVVFILLNILKLIILLLLVNHFVASLWYLMGGLANAGTPNWRDAYGMQPGTQPLSYRYATALHWSLTQFTPATVDVHPQNMVERTFAILVLIFGLVLFSSFVSSITASMTQLRNMQEDKSKQFWLLRRYLLQKKVPQDLTFKVLRYTEYATSRSGEAIPEHRITILSLLTKQLQSELRFVTHFGCVKLHGFFKLVCTMNESLLHMMSTGKALVSKALASQDPLFELVDPALCMYFVDQGQVQYCQGQSALGLGGGLSTWAPSNFDSEGLLPPDPETVQPVTPTESGIAIGKGGHLCEIVLWAQWRHVGSARAIHESNIVQVIAKGFAECIRRDPAVDSVAAMYARMFVQLANDRERIPEDWQEICNDEMTALTDSLSEYSPDSETPKNLMSRIMALTKPKARSF